MSYSVGDRKEQAIYFLQEYVWFHSFSRKELEKKLGKLGFELEKIEAMTAELFDRFNWRKIYLPV